MDGFLYVKQLKTSGSADGVAILRPGAVSISKKFLNPLSFVWQFSDSTS
jgi:hypothetical protein